jgi:hypothetical protein
VNNFLDQLNLTPQERRIVVAIGMVFIIVLNFLFVWPHFGEWKRIRGQLGDMRNNIEKYNKIIATDTNPTNGWQKQLQKLVRQEGNVEMNEQVQLQSTIRLQARKTGVNVPNYMPGAPKPDTNGFFEEESEKINIDSPEEQLIDFLYNIGGDPAMIRVSELELSPQDQNRYRLRGTVTLIANYAVRAPPPAAAAAKPGPGKSPSGPGAKPAAASTNAKPPPGGAKPGTPPGRTNQPGQPGHRGATPPGQRGPPSPGSNPVPKFPLVPSKKTTGS